jgi:hypothetical protein
MARLRADQRRPLPVDLTAAALASLVAAAVATAVLLSEPFAHGTWLVAYLVLVGCAAQLLLGRGQAAVLAAAGRATPPGRVRLAQVALWNLGVVAVPAGVLAGSRLLVVVGSVSLLAAMASLWRCVRPALGRQRWLGPSYVALLVAMTSSVFVGTALAWDTPWL